MLPVAPIPLLKHRARLLARRESIPLYTALDRVAKQEGFERWSLLAAQPHRSAAPDVAPLQVVTTLPPLLPTLTEGDLVLIGARPGQGKTLLGLRLLLEAVLSGRRALFFTLEYTETDTRARLEKLRGSIAGSATTQPTDGIEIVASDDISADTIAAHLEGVPPGTVIVVDYLQILDQDRRKPPLGEQVDVLRRLARTRGIVLATLSQIDRRFDGAQDAPPTWDEVRLPNPVAKAAFTKTCFLHAGHIHFG